MIRKKIATKRLELRPYTIKDYKTWSDAYTGLLPRQHHHDQGPYARHECSWEVFNSFVKRHEELASKDRTYIWGIYLNNTGEQVGTIDIHILVRDEIQKANLGYRIFNNYWRKGYAKEALSAAIDLAFKNLKLNRLEAVIDLDNEASIALVKSLKFDCEGIRKKYFFQNGHWEDQIVYTVNREDRGFKKLRLN